MATAAVARAELEALLRTRKLDRTLTPGDGAEAEGQRAVEREWVATGVPTFDEALGGGWPRGEMSEVVGPRSSGRGSVVAASLASLARQGGIAAFVDTLDMLDPESMAGAGVGLDRVLWIRGDATCQAGPAITGRLSSVVNGQDRALDRAVKATNLVLQAGGFDLVVVDLAEVQPEALRRLPFTTWFRLQRTLENSRTVCLLVGAAPIARSTGGVTLQLARAERGRGRGQWLGGATAPRLFTGLDIEARVIRSRVPDSTTRRVQSVAVDTPACRAEAMRGEASDRSIAKAGPKATRGEHSPEAWRRRR